MTGVLVVHVWDAINWPRIAVMAAVSQPECHRLLRPLRDCDSGVSEERRQPAPEPASLTDVERVRGRKDPNVPRRKDLKKKIDGERALDRSLPAGGGHTRLADLNIASTEDPRWLNLL